MSKIRFGRMLDIANCTEEQLVKAVSRLAEMLGGKVVNQVTDYAGRNPQRVTTGIELGENRSIGFVIRNGNVVPVGDDYLWREEYANMSNLLRQTHNSLLMGQKLRQRGYQLQTQIKVVGGVNGKVQGNLTGMMM